MEGQRFALGGSIPIEKAMNPEVLLVYEMTGQPLTAEHGFPLRVVAPGYIGARSVKWLSNITLQAEPSSNYYQAYSYKLFPPEIDLSPCLLAVPLVLALVALLKGYCEVFDQTFIAQYLVPMSSL